MGFLLGIAAGIVPGLHPNMIALIALISFSHPSSFIVVAVMLVSSQFFAFLRSVFLFVPDESHALALHPIYKMVGDGNGLFAVKLGLTGILLALILSIIASPLLNLIIPFLFSNISPYIPFMLLTVSVFFIFKDKKPLYALIIFLLAGALGFFGLDRLNQPLMVMLAGFFSMPVLLTMNPKIPIQKSTFRKIERKIMFKGSLSSFLAAFFAIFLPGVGPAQASLITRGLMKRTEEFILSIGALSGFNITFSAILLHTVNKSRVGALVMLGQNYVFGLNALLTFLFVCLSVGLICYVLIIHLSKRITKIIPKINYQKISVATIILLSGFVLYFDLWMGLLFFVLATMIGFIASKLKVRMANCMGCLVLPLLIFYFL